MANSFIGQSDLPIGLRNNNPGDIKTGEAWQGMTGSEGAFVTFANIQWGTRALATDLLNKIREGYDTISEIVNRYAPASDKNNVPAYINALTAETGIGADEQLGMDADTLRSLMRGIIDHELGQPYAGMVSGDDIDAGISMVNNTLLSLIQAAGVAAGNLASTGNTAGQDAGGGAAEGGISIWVILGGLVLIGGAWYFVAKSKRA